MVATGIVFLAATLVALAFIHTEVWHLVIGKVLVALASGICVTAMVARPPPLSITATPASPPAWSW